MIRQSGLYTNPADRLYFVSHVDVFWDAQLFLRNCSMCSSLFSPSCLRFFFAIFREYTLDVYRMTSVVTEVSANN